MNVPKAPVKTGGVLRMKEPHGEGVATHTGPESCGDTSNGVTEALTGVRTGQVWSHEIHLSSRCRRCGTRRKAILPESIVREAGRPCGVEDLEHVRKHTTREPGDPMFALGLRLAGGRIGKSKDTSQ
jgi:hypothetical protein